MSENFLSGTHSLEEVISMATAANLLLWSPRVLGILFSLFLGFFALDALGEGITAILLHLTPPLLLLMGVALSWRRPLRGAVVFAVIAVLVSVPAWSRGDTGLPIAGPLLLITLLYLWSARRPAERAQARDRLRGAP